MTICGICNQPEGNDPKAHICECKECGLEYEDYKADCDCNEEEK